MGTVYAKAPEPATVNNPPQEGPDDIDFEHIPVKVERVVVEGVGRTKDDVIIKEVRPLLKAETFQEMVQKSHEVKQRMEKLGLFKRVGIFIDTAKDSANKDSYEITFEVREFRPISGGMNTLIGNNDASLLFGVKLPNVLGRGEKVNGEYTHGTKQTRGYSVMMSKPLNANPEILLSGGIYQFHGSYPWSGYKETDRGLDIDLTFPSVLGMHSLRWDGVWRDLRSLSRTTSFAVREQAGHSLKSSLKHVFVRDMRDDGILPSSGSLLRLTQEYAGLGGNVEFSKQELELQFNKSLFWDTVVQLSLAGGVMRPLHKKDDIRINDRFFLGGPLTLRGFSLKGVGPHSDGNALGAEAYWMCAAHIYTPLPFRPGKGGFGDLFRTHFFVNGGNLGNINFNDLQGSLKDMGNDIRWACGWGIVLRMGRVARMELNYVVPMAVKQGDSVNPGLQFGIGLSFL
ncbi:sorting and assembly machinery component 50 homolog A-like isoform X2 [Littorina saxatilis]|uniref:POTRA domain-containing protein n=1 Tax=Littorina saxatilis TaxID=31220 RepID=A0AAN9G8J5_9CAEN